MLNRYINPLKSDSFFLFGPRGCGKTTFLRSFFSEVDSIYINLLSIDEEDFFSRNPDGLIERVNAARKINPNLSWVIIDEIQKIPKLLDVVHNIIETPKNIIKFAMTGSSAKKLKKHGANLLAGRAFVNRMYPFTYRELGEHFLLNDSLSYGMLPKIFSYQNELQKKEFLKAYAQTYLKEEIWAEHLIRNLDTFRKYLEVASQCNSEIVNYSKIAKQIGTTTVTVQSYFEILEETLIGFTLNAYSTSIRKRIISAPKFYFFDTGVKRALDRTIGIELQESSYEYGKLFETFIINQIKSLIDYERKEYELFYIKTKDGAEIDLVIDRPGLPPLLLEIKSSKVVLDTEISNLKTFAKDLNGKAYCISLEKYSRIVDNVFLTNWKDFLDNHLFA